MTRRIRLIADDYGLAPGVSAAILDLLERGRLTGTSCMTGFGEWQEAANRIRPLCGRAAVGLHLTLTDQPAVTGRSSLAPEGRLPPLGSLALPFVRGRVDERDVHAELDAQHSRFLEALGRQPDFIDGHQHVHFLPVVRKWLRTHFSESAGRPPLRGSPALGDAAVAPKIAAIAAVAAGFNRSMARAGFTVMEPLTGIYDWKQPDRFAPLLQAAVDTLPERGLFMCHPGHVDETLRARDPMQSVREVEFSVLASDAFGASLARAGVEIRDGRGMSGADQPGRSTGSKIVRFAIVGLVNTAIDLAGFFLLLKLHVPPLPANIVSWSIAVVFSFVANGFWSFERNHAIRLRDAFLRFVSLGALISLGVSSLSIAVFAGIAGVWPAKVGGVIVAAVLNFLAARWSIEGRVSR